MDSSSIAIWRSNQVVMDASVPDKAILLRQDRISRHEPRTFGSSRDRREAFDRLISPGITGCRVAFLELEISLPFYAALGPRGQTARTWR